MGAVTGEAVVTWLELAVFLGLAVEDPEARALCGELGLFDDESDENGQKGQRNQSPNCSCGRDNNETTVRIGDPDFAMDLRRCLSRSSFRCSRRPAADPT